MTTFIHFFRERLIHYDEICAVPDALLRDIGLSKMLADFSITHSAGSGDRFSRRAIRKQFESGPSH
jgi:hypothetical protein